MKIIVIGGSGLIGSKLVAKLRERGDKSILVIEYPDARVMVEAEVPSATLWGFPRFVHSIDSGAIYFYY